MAKKRIKYTVTDLGTRDGIRDFRVQENDQPDYECAGVWVGRSDIPRCASCSGRLTAMLASCPHTNAVKRFLKHEQHSTQ